MPPIPFDPVKGGANPCLVSEAALGLAPRRLRRKALRLELTGAHLHVKRHLVVDLPAKPGGEIAPVPGPAAVVLHRPVAGASSACSIARAYRTNSPVSFRRWILPFGVRR